MCSKPCQEMQNLDAMHRSVLQVISSRTEFNDEKDAQMFMTQPVDKQDDQLTFKEFYDPFTGSKTE